MARLPAFCNGCGAVYSSGINALGGPTTVQIHNVQIQCPNCGAMGQVPDGTYEAAREALAFLGGPALSHQQLWRLQEIIRRGRDSSASAEEVTETVEAALPETKNLLEAWRSSPEARLALLVVLVGFVLDHAGSIPWDEMAKIIEHLIQQASAHGWGAAAAR
jgi:hypothetical protein